MQPTILVLAAGMGSRYGGLKQLDPLGPRGETLLDYSVRDAAAAGFGRAVFVIRRDFAEAFENTVGRRCASVIDVGYAFQELDDLPDGFRVPEGRARPWGTAHAVRAARGRVGEPFAVINADDFYGAQAYKQVAAHLRGLDPGRLACCLVGYRLDNTLSEYGPVNRGLCRVVDGRLRGIAEHTGIRRGREGRIRGKAPDGAAVELAEDALVSMNLWGFTPAVFEAIETAFTTFLQTHGEEEKSECYLPAVVDELLRGGRAECAVLETDASWFGVTYPKDKAFVQAALARLTR
jgi:NDP-sugar pyrophosphorylase family protein